LDNKSSAFQQSPGAILFALWHENLFTGIMTHGHQRLAPLASLSKDGDLVARVMKGLGYHPVRGSGSRGGPQARDEMAEVITQGLCPTITVDGPKGPRRVVKGGIIDVARRSGCAILPMTPVSSRYFVFKRSWDHFRLPLPFSHVKVYYGTPIIVPKETKGLAFGNRKADLKRALEEGEKRVQA
jgi:lysophospholipid acyltransferase (LPLAT)-like uncharacterized protein